MTGVIFVGKVPVFVHGSSRKSCTGKACPSPRPVSDVKVQAAGSFVGIVALILIVLFVVVLNKLK